MWPDVPRYQLHALPPLVPPKYLRPNAPASIPVLVSDYTKQRNSQRASPARRRPGPGCTWRSRMGSPLHINRQQPKLPPVRRRACSRMGDSQCAPIARSPWQTPSHSPRTCTASEGPPLAHSPAPLLPQTRALPPSSSLRRRSRSRRRGCQCPRGLEEGWGGRGRWRGAWWRAEVPGSEGL